MEVALTEGPRKSLRAASARYEVVEIDSDHLKAVSQNLVFMIWRVRTLASAFRAGIGLIEKRALLYPKGIGLLHVVETEGVPPDKETRGAFNEALKLKPIRHYCVIHDAPGFTAASVRAIVSAAYLLARPAFPHAVHSSVREAARWAAKQNELIGRRDDAQNIEAALQALRRHHQERYPGPGP